jgi:hypothetical protein
MKASLKSAMAWLAASILAAGSASAASVTATDGGTAVYGACNGVAIDFDATAAPNAVWIPGLTSGQVYALNSVAIKNAAGNTGTYYFAGTGTVITAGAAFNFNTTMPDNTNGGSYFVVAPIGPSGISLLGDANKFVMRGKKRISSFSDNGLLRATIAFAAGETNITLCGYAPSNPHVLTPAGSTNNLAYNPTTHFFMLNVSPDNSGTASVALSLAPRPSLSIAQNLSGQFEISWPAAAVGYVLEEATNATPPVDWSPVSDSGTSINGQTTVTVTNDGSAAFYRLRQ